MYNNPFVLSLSYYYYLRTVTVFCFCYCGNSAVEANRSRGIIVILISVQ